MIFGRLDFDSEAINNVKDAVLGGQCCGSGFSIRFLLDLRIRDPD